MLASYGWTLWGCTLLTCFEETPGPHAHIMSHRTTTSLHKAKDAGAQTSEPQLCRTNDILSVYAATPGSIRLSLRLQCAQCACMKSSVVVAEPSTLPQVCVFDPKIPNPLLGPMLVPQEVLTGSLRRDYCVVKLDYLQAPHHRTHRKYLQCNGSIRPRIE